MPASRYEYLVMAQLLICPSGHEWQTDDERGTCPVCGATAELDADLDDTHKPADELPPRPKSSPMVRPVVHNENTEIGSSFDQTQSMRAPVELPRVLGYETLGILGRGGMGVVYKARQVSLNRVVALKMVLAAEHADPRELTRFRTEGEAVAQLHHPHIVQIFEVGEYAGRPFLALEYLEGGSLEARLDGTPLLPRHAAELVATLARAIHYAHGRGIVHRDLKPANILLQIADCGLRIEPNAISLPDPQSAIRTPQSAIPKITDFGLAKRLDAPGQTQTGQVMGTPSYMAPEQAAGDSKAIGPACDIYALGAILYELLTGRPPFKAATSMETLQQVLYADPASPTSLQPQTPFDLETIALKCLHKDPQKRYASAQDLADDLERYLAGQPILARRVSWFERLLKWVKRRPAVAALLGVSVAAVLCLIALGAWSYAEIEDALEQTEIQRDAATRQGQRAERNFDQARKAVQRLMRVAKDKLSHLPRMEQEHRAILLEAVKFYETLQKEENSPAVRQNIAEAYALMGAAEERFGNFDQAEVYQRRSLAIRRDLVAEFPGRHDYEHDLANSLSHLGGVLEQCGRYAEAEDWYGQTMVARQRLAKLILTITNIKPSWARSITIWGFYCGLSAAIGRR
jgi:serine/threonine protein kinase